MGSTDSTPKAKLVMERSGRSCVVTFCEVTESSTTDRATEALKELARHLGRQAARQMAREYDDAQAGRIASECV